MNRKLSLVLLLGATLAVAPLLTRTASAQTSSAPAAIDAPAPPLVQTPADFFASLQTALANVNTNLNYFADQELELKIGGIYAQSTGEGGVVTDIEDWGRFAKNLGIGVQIIEGSNKGKAGTMAGFTYAEYRKPLGNVAAGVFAGAGYDRVNSQPMGIVGVGIYYRTSPHLGVWSRIGFGIESGGADRGMIAGGGISYSF
jgi:hypothetical protein